MIHNLHIAFILLNNFNIYTLILLLHIFDITKYYCIFLCHLKMAEKGLNM